MRALAFETGDITSDNLQLYSQVIGVIRALPNGLTCHEVCRRITIIMDGFIHYKGTFAGADHSWLVLKENPLILIDAYPWACGSGPIMITLEGILNPWRKIYIGVPVS
jgi:hypothetical protein